MKIYTVIAVVLLVTALVLISGCSSLTPKPPITNDTPVRDVSKEAGIIEELSISGCDIKKFVTAESSRQNIISVTCK